MSRVDFSDARTIAFLADALQAAGVAGIEIERPGQKIRVVIDPVTGSGRPQVTTAGVGLAQALVSEVCAPMAGIFEVRASDDVGLSAASARVLKAGDVLGFIRIGPVLVPVAARADARAIRVVAEPGSLVGYATVLFEIEMNA